MSFLTLCLSCCICLVLGKVNRLVFGQVVALFLCLMLFVVLVLVFCLLMIFSCVLGFVLVLGLFLGVVLVRVSFVLF